ncbi:MAG: sensory box histidine kinase [Myxococcales bacterium]|nr:sensory box histidine kinase [Myxococcales bacterium]
MSGDASTDTQQPPRLCDFLRKDRERIIRQWKSLVRDVPAASTLSGPPLVDHFPELLMSIAEILETLHTGEVKSLADLPKLHALDRLDRGFDLKEVTAEYALLRRCVLDIYEADFGPHIRIDEVRRFNEAVDEAIRESVHYFSEQRTRVLTALDKVAASAAGRRSLADLLDNLMRVCVETIPAADESTILLLGDDGRLHVRASIGVEGGVERAWTLAADEGFAGKIAMTRQPMTLRNAAEDPLVKSPHLKAAGIRALHGVPLELNGALVGVAHLGSRTAYELSDEDKALFRALTTKATIFIYESVLRTQAERRAAELDAVFEAIPDGVYIGDAGGIHRVNRAGLRVLGLEQSEVLHASLEELVTRIDTRWPDSNRQISMEEQVFSRALAGEVAEYEVVVRCASTSEDVMLRSIAAPILLHGSIVGAVAVNTDITERKRIERALAEERARIGAVLENIPVGVLLVAADGEVVLANQNVEELIGSSPETRAAMPLARALGGESVRGEQLSLVRDGERRFMEVSAVPIYDHDRIVAVVAVIADITDRKREEESAAARAGFEQQLIGIVSHDLRNPLGAITMALTIGLRRVEDPRVRTILTTALAATDRATRLIADLLDFTRARLGSGLPVALRDVDVHEVARHVVEEVMVANPGRRVTHDAVGEATGQFDADRVAQMLSNLLTNAVRYSPDESVVEVCTRGVEGAVRIEVANLGEPIPPELTARIFEPLQRATGRGGGIGLGLFIVREIVRAHGGKVTVQSSAAQGTRFTVELPRLPPR